MKNSGLKVKGLALYVNERTGLVRVGSKGRSLGAGLFFGTLTRGEARKLRKLLHSQGYSKVSSEPRCLLDDEAA